MTPGLRERKRRETRVAIERAAVGLACERGCAEVTVADVCARADVSRSTFFNYMPSLDAAIFGRPLVLEDEEAALAVLDEHGANIPRALNLVSVAASDDDVVDSEVMSGRRRLIAEQPDTIGRWEETFSPLRHQLVGLTARWLHAHPERRVLGEDELVREALLLVNASGAVATVLMDRWADGPQGGEVVATAEDFDRGFADLKRVIAAHR
ncbi:MAG: TetR family transcriptional regulator [Actinobacteria bacterium]|nr:TetR family transcriptional regulator [Actinomycetota bacterium]